MTTLIRMRRLALVVPAIACLLLCGRADGAILYSGVQDISIPADFNGVYLDFADYTDATSFTTSSTEPANWDFNLFYGGAALGNSDTFAPVTATATTNADVVNQTPWVDTITAGDNYPSSFSGSTGHMGTEFVSGNQGIIGFKIKDASFTTTAPGYDVFGFMRVTLRDDGSVGTIHDWWWEDSGGSITVIPEPGAVGVTAAFLLSGLLLHRRRRKSA